MYIKICVSYNDILTYKAFRDRILCELGAVTSALPDDSHHIFLLGLHKGFAVACAQIEVPDEEAAILRFLGVEEKFRAQKFGSKLLQLVEKYVFLEHNAKALYLNTRQSTQRFYMQYDHQPQVWEKNQPTFPHTLSLYKPLTNLVLR